MKINPFKYGQVVEGEFFTNREKEIKEISCEMVSGEHIILISPRRFGKTSLVLKAIKKIKLPYIKFDMQLMTDEMDFANQFIKKALSLSKFEKIKHYLKHFRIQPAIQYNNAMNDISLVINPDRTNINTYLEDALELPEKIAKVLKKRIIILFDEFQDIRRISKNLEKKMRAVFQHHKHISYVFIGSQEHMIRDIFINKNNPFYKFGKQIVLKNIDIPKMKEFIVKRFKKENLDSLKIIDQVITITNGHPYYTQQLCHEIFNITDRKKIDAVLVDQAITNIISNHYYDYMNWWNNLDNTERKIMIGLCNNSRQPTSKEFINAYGITSASTAGSALSRLMSKGILIKQIEDNYCIEDIFWKKWINQNRK